MKDVKVTELRARLPAYLERVRRGEHLKVTSRGHVIAEIVPPTPNVENASAARKLLRGSVVCFNRPLEPVVAPDEWDVNR
ncbi:MAG: type II toxin-antitoxin system prevent-host-death family antitoxin [Steroidobacteraceae bacterium]|jgi:prevent-host-death family protein